MNRPARVSALVVALGSVVFLAFAVASTGGHRIAGMLVVLAIFWGSTTFVVDTFLGESSRSRPAGRRAVTLTSVVRLGAESADVARMAIAVASQHGPTVVVTAGRSDLSDVIDLDEVRLYEAPTMEEALHRAVQEIDTDVVLITSASAIPIRQVAEKAAEAIHDRVGWVTGRTLVLDSGGYAPDGRDLLSGHLRARARAGGMVVWEPDATVLSTQLLRDHPVTPGRPWGCWLREVAALGYGGVQTDETLSLRSSPTDSKAFWPATIARQRVSVADLSGAMRAGSVRARLLAFSLLLRELYAVPLCIWLLSPIIVAWAGGFPLDQDPLVFVGLLASLSSARWMTSRWVHGVKMTPRDDALNLAYGAPGSLLALPAAASPAASRTRFRVSERILVWAAIGLTAVVAYPLMNGDSTSASGRAAAAFALVDLVVLWMLALRVAAQRKWERTTWRIPVDVLVLVGGNIAQTRDGSLSGLAVSGALSSIAVGTDVEVHICLDDHSVIETNAKVVGRRRAFDDEFVLGLSMSLSRGDRVRWANQLLAPLIDAAQMPGVSPQSMRGVTIGGLIRAPKAKSKTSAVLDRLVMSCVVLMSAVAVGALALILLGYRPLVVRSGSMIPTISIGDTVIVERVPASGVVPGDIVTFDDPEGGGESMTHRVVAVNVDDGRLRFETRGDANDVSEFWFRSQDSLVDRQVWTVPVVGGWITKLDHDPRTALVWFAAILILLAVVDGIAGRSRPVDLSRAASSESGV